MGWFDWIFRPRPKPIPMPTPDNSIDLRELLVAVNKERIKRNLPAYISTDKISKMAQDWANEMAKNMTMTHGNFDSRMTHAYPASSGGEDVAAGQLSIQQVMNTWMNSVPHRSAILSQSYKNMGSGVAKGRNNVNYWCLDFTSSVE